MPGTTDLSTARDLSAVVAELERLPGQVSFQVARLDKQPQVLAELAPERSMAIGSAFKLFVLGALVEDLAQARRKWSDVVTLQERWKSLPSGVLHDWPGGSPLTLHTLATLMISQGDNSAADHLLFTLGRERVEQALGTMGVADAQRSVPLLATRELFLVKYGPDLEAYVAKDTLGRRAYLAAGNITQQKLAAVVPGTTPTAIDRLEWFASAADLVKALEWFRTNTEAGEMARARRVLNIAPPPGEPDKQAWPYVGHKGGSEPGVLSLNYLLRSARGGWYALSATWNDETAPLDEARFVALIARAIELTA